jgi:hypothetical protein
LEYSNGCRNRFGMRCFLQWCVFCFRVPPSLLLICVVAAKNKEQVTNANGISACLLLLGESFRGREKLFQSVLKLMATLVSNPGIAAIFCDSKQHPDSLSTILSLIRNNDRPFLLRRYALKVIAELSRHEDLHEKLTSAGIDSNLFIVVLNSAKTNGLINDSLTPSVVASIARLSITGTQVTILIAYFYLC